MKHLRKQIAGYLLTLILLMAGIVFPGSGEKVLASGGSMTVHFLMWDRDYPFWCSQRDRICCMMVVQEARPAMWCPICRSRMCQKLII